jgi:hypothetical protein
MLGRERGERQLDDRDRDHERAQQLIALAANFRAFLADQTGVELVSVDGLTTADLPTALERLDLALGQLADLTTVYGDDSRGMLDPLAAPAAVAVGDYLRAALGASWQASDPLAPEELVILIPGQPALDLLGLARVALSGGTPHLAALVTQGMRVT